MTPEEAAAAVERYDCPNCEAMAPSPCRTRGGKVASKYHTARFILVPALRDLLDVPVPGGRRPGALWQALPPVAPAEVAPSAPPIRIGYARCSTKDQELESQLVALRAAGCTRIFAEKISTRVKVRPECEAALALCRDIKSAAPGQAVVFTVHELKRPVRPAWSGNGPSAGALFNAESRGGGAARARRYVGSPPGRRHAAEPCSTQWITHIIH